MTGSLYVCGDSWLHRLPAGIKLALLAALGASLMWWSDVLFLLLTLLVLIFLLAQSGVRTALVWRQIRPMLLLLVVLAMYTSVVQTPADALEMTLRLLSLMLSGVLVTLTTPLTAMMAVLERLLQPFEKIGLVKADRVALTFGLALRLIPELSLQWNDIREAQAARGVRTTILTLCVPMLIRTLRRADEIAEAIDARSLR
jgi:biotin transport system permease protein